LFKIEAEII
jgi:hypothetical protein